MESRAMEVVEVNPLTVEEARAYVRKGAYLVSPHTHVRFRRLRISEAYNEPGKTVMVRCALLGTWADRWLHAIGFAKPPADCYFDTDHMVWRRSKVGERTFPEKVVMVDGSNGSPKEWHIEHGPPVHLVPGPEWRSGWAADEGFKDHPDQVAMDTAAFG